MRRRLVLAAVALATLSLSACGREDRDAAVVENAQAGGAANPAAVAEAEAPAPTTTDGFVTRAALSDLYEIQSSQLALERSQSAAIKAYAQRMIDEHTRMSNELKAVIAQAGLTARTPTVLDTEGVELMTALREASDADFDDRYIDQQIEAHEKAFNLFRDFGNNGDNGELKQLAARSGPAIETHLQTVRALDESQADDAPAAGGAAAPATSN